MFSTISAFIVFVSMNMNDKYVWVIKEALQSQGRNSFFFFFFITKHEFSVMR